MRVLVVAGRAAPTVVGAVTTLWAVRDIVVVVAVIVESAAAKAAVLADTPATATPHP